MSFWSWDCREARIRDLSSFEFKIYLLNLAIAPIVQIVVLRLKDSILQILIPDALIDLRNLLLNSVGYPVLNK